MEGINKKGAMVLCMLLLVVPMAFAGNPYDLQVEVKDGFLDSSLGDVNVTVDGITKKTNVNGIAGFENLGNGTHTVELERKEYKSREKQVNLEDKSEVIVGMEKSTMYQEERKNSTKTPDVSIKGLENNSVIQKNPLSVEFNVNSPAPLTECRLLLQKDGLVGYESGDKTEEESTLRAEITNDKYIVRVMCENKFGISYSSNYNVRGEGLEQQDKKVQEDKDENSDSENKVDLPEYDSLIDKALSAKKKLMTAGGARKASAKTLGLIEKLKEKIKEAESLRKSRENLEGLGLSESSYKKKKNDYADELNKLKRTTPVDIKLKKDERVLDPVSKQETKKAVEKYLGNEEGDVEKITKQSQRLQQHITTYMNLRVVQVEYVRGNGKTFSIINKEFQLEGNISGGFFVELIPEDFASKLSQLEIPFRYELIEESVIKFKRQEEITYYVKGEKDLETMKKAKSVFITEEEKTSNSITGYSIRDTLEMGKGNALLIFIALIGIVGSTFAVKKTDYTKLKQNIPGVIKPQQQEVDVNNYVQLLQTAMDYLNQKREKEAIELYPSIIKGYKQLGEKSQKELQPMVAHLGKLVDSQYFCGLVDQACKKMSEGPFDTNSKTCGEIERVYSEMPDDMAMKLKEKYEFYRQMLGLKNQRQDEKARMVYERHMKDGIGNVVEDRIFGGETS